MTINEDALTAEEVAGILQVNKNTIYNLVKAGKINSYNIGRKIRFTMKDVQAYIALSKTNATQKTIDIALADTNDVIDREHAFIIAGQDVMLDVLANYLAGSGINALRAYTGSYNGLVNIYLNKVHTAAIHLWDGETNTYNLPYVKRLVPGTPIIMIHLAIRRQGLLVRRGNPKNIRAWSDLLRPDVTIINREKGAGSRILLDEHLVQLEADHSQVKGYNRETSSMLALGSLIARGGADVGVGIERVYHQIEGLDFIPLQDEELALVIRKSEHTKKAIQAIKYIVGSVGFQEGFKITPGYNISRMGHVLYES